MRRSPASLRRGLAEPLALGRTGRMLGRETVGAHDELHRHVAVDVAVGQRRSALPAHLRDARRAADVELAGLRAHEGGAPVGELLLAAAVTAAAAALVEDLIPPAAGRVVLVD